MIDPHSKNNTYNTVTASSSRAVMHWDVYKKYKKHLMLSDPLEISFFISLNEEIEKNKLFLDESPFQNQTEEDNYCKENICHGSLCKSLFKIRATNIKGRCESSKHSYV